MLTLIAYYYFKKNKDGNDEYHTRGVNIGWAVVEEANSNCCKLWMRVHLKEKIYIDVKYKSLKKLLVFLMAQEAWLLQLN